MSDTTHTDNVACPHCGHEHKDSWEIGSGGEEDGKHECAECDKPFLYSRHVSITYSTKPVSSSPEV